MPPVVAAEGHEGAAWSYLLRWKDIHAAHGHAIAAVAAADRAASTELAITGSGDFGRNRVAARLGPGLRGHATSRCRVLDRPSSSTRVMQHPDFARAVGPGVVRSPRRSHGSVRDARGTGIGARAMRSRDRACCSGCRTSHWQQGRWRRGRELAAEAAAGSETRRPATRFGLLLFSEAVVDAHLGRSLADRRPTLSELSAMIDRVATGHGRAGQRRPGDRRRAELGPLVAQLEAAGVVSPVPSGRQPTRSKRSSGSAGSTTPPRSLDRHQQRARASSSPRRAGQRPSRPRRCCTPLAARWMPRRSLRTQALAHGGPKPLPPFERARALLVGGDRGPQGEAEARRHACVSRRREQIFASLGAVAWRQRASRRPCPHRRAHRRPAD